MPRAVFVLPPLGRDGVAHALHFGESRVMLRIVLSPVPWLILAPAERGPRLACVDLPAILPRHVPETSKREARGARAED
jgi:hypothetical protein